MRKSPIYGNYCIYSPNGELMFRCLEKRAKWYLKRGLAHTIGENPPSIQLDFTPKGKGVLLDALKEERKNICVVCGSEEDLSRHHIIPSIYRRHFPEDKKDHAAIFVVALCLDCHRKYNNEFADDFEKELSVKYDAPLDGDKLKWQILGTVQNLIVKKDIPEDRKEQMREWAFNGLLDLGIKDIEKDTLKSLETLKDVRTRVKKCEKGKRFHGQLVVAKVKNLIEFESMWAKHFLDNMKPKHLHPAIISELNGWSTRT